MKYLFITATLLLFINCEKTDVYPYPDLLPLPNGFQPEGIVLGPSHSFYVASLITGDIYKGDIRTGEGEIFISNTTPAPSGGLSLDTRSKYLYVAGGFSGSARVYDYETGEMILNLILSSQDTPGPTLINDVIVANQAVYFSDSFRPVIYKVLLNNHTGLIQNQNKVDYIPLSGDFSMAPHPGNPMPLGAFANGIEATSDGKFLILANTDRGEIYRIDPQTGETTTIDLGEVLVFYADGILLENKMLYVAQNMMNQITVIKLNNDYNSGTVLKVIGADQYPDFGIPTTMDDHENNLYIVNSHFDIAPPPSIHPEVEFEIIKIAK